MATWRTLLPSNGGTATLKYAGVKGGKATITALCLRTPYSSPLPLHLGPRASGGPILSCYIRLSGLSRDRYPLYSLMASPAALPLPPDSNLGHSPAFRPDVARGLKDT
jgi:hypothetical protein